MLFSGLMTRGLANWVLGVFGSLSTGSGVILNPVRRPKATLSKALA